jgi:hypothetical protein
MSINKSIHQSKPHLQVTNTRNIIISKYFVMCYVSQGEWRCTTSVCVCVCVTLLFGRITENSNHIFRPSEYIAFISVKFLKENKYFLLSGHSIPLYEVHSKCSCNAVTKHILPSIHWSLTDGNSVRNEQRDGSLALLYIRVY